MSRQQPRVNDAMKVFAKEGRGPFQNFARMPEETKQTIQALAEQGRATPFTPNPIIPQKVRDTVAALQAQGRTVPFSFYFNKAAMFNPTTGGMNK